MASVPRAVALHRSSPVPRPPSAIIQHKSPRPLLKHLCSQNYPFANRVSGDCLPNWLEHACSKFIIPSLLGTNSMTPHNLQGVPRFRENTMVNNEVMPNIFEGQEEGISFERDLAFTASASAAVLIHSILLYAWRQVADAKPTNKNQRASHWG